MIGLGRYYAVFSMTQLTQPKNSPQPPTSHRRKSDPPWLWVALMSGSVAVHAVLLALSLPALTRIAERPVDSASIAVDFVELPDEASSIGLSDQPKQVDSSGANSAGDAPDALENLPASATTSLPVPDPTAIGFASEVPTTFTTPAPAAPLPSPEPITPDPPPEAPFTAPASEIPDSAPPTSEAPNSEVSPLPSSVGAIPPLPTTSPTPPGFSTIPIDIPVPDVSATLPLPGANVDPSTLSQTGVNQTATPVRLLASLTFDRIPADEAGDDPEQLAAPIDDIATQEIADPRTSPCFSAIQPEALRSLGTSVGFQVSTDPTGAITQTLLRESSQNAAYDALAQCLVQQWQFNPATTAGEPVASNALLVRITIESLTNEGNIPE